MARGLENWLVQLGQRVISSTDSEQEKLNKTLAIFASGLMGFGAMLWLAIYWAMGIKFSATVPFSYLVLSAGSLGLYLWKRNFELFRFVQVSLFLFVPFIMQWSIGSYVSSSGDAVGAPRAGGRHDLPGTARVAAVVLRLHRDDGDLRLLRLLPR